MSPYNGDWPRATYRQIGAAAVGVLTVHLLHRGVFAHLPLWGVRPDLPLVVALLIGIARGPRAGLVYGMAFGFASDILGGLLVGAHAVTYGIGGYAAGWIVSRMFRDTILVPMAVIGALTVAVQLLYLVIANAFGLDLPWGEGLFTFGFPSAVYNALLVPPIHIGLRWWRKRAEALSPVVRRPL